MILVTGGSGMLGRQVVNHLGRDCYAPPSHELNLLNAYNIRAWLRARPHVKAVVHLAALVGGINDLEERPEDYYYPNLVMGANMAHEAALAGVQRFIAAGSVCSYPEDAPLPFLEETMWWGYPERLNAPYGIAKRVLEAHLGACEAQYGMDWCVLVMANLYGPGDRSGHAIPQITAKIRRALQDGEDVVKLRGRPDATRDFLFVGDAAQAVVLAAQDPSWSGLVNLPGSGEVEIGLVAAEIARQLGWGGKFEWDGKSPGQARRQVSGWLAGRLGWQPATSLAAGLAAWLAAK